MSAWLGNVPPYAGPAVVALILLAESGLLIGVALPGASLVIGLGVLTGIGALPFPVAVAAVACATVLGAAFGHRNARRGGAGRLLPAGGLLGRLLPQRAGDVVERYVAPWADAIGHRPVRAAAIAQFVAGARTLAPRIAAHTGVPLGTMLLGTLPAALVWSSGLVTAGAVAGAALPLLRGAVAFVGIPLIVAATWIVVRRRAAMGLPSAA